MEVIKLKNIYLGENDGKKEAAYKNDFEKTFQMILEKNLQIKKIGIDDDILNLGADSLTLMKNASLSRDVIFVNRYLSDRLIYNKNSLALFNFHM